MQNGWHFGTECNSDSGNIDTTLQLKINSDGPTLEQICDNADKRSHHQFLHYHNKRTLKQVTKSEKSIKIGFAYVILKYFNALRVVQDERKRWHDENDVNHGGNTSRNKEMHHSVERSRMIEEEKNAKYRRDRIAYANEKARLGAEKIRARTEKAAAEKVCYW